MPKYYVFIVLSFFIIGCSQDSSITKEPFDQTYKAYQNVLQNYVKNEFVDYLKLKENRANLDSFINQLAGTTKKQLKNMSRNEQLAYWINAYNGITLRSIIDHYPVSSIQNINGVWTQNKWHVAGKELTLDFIEHKIVRPTYKDARIHFALNCASIGCPPLYNQPFTGNTVDSLLDIVASQFVHNKKRHNIDYKNHLIITTELFSWFWEDFVRNFNDIKFKNSSDVENAVLNFTYKYLNDTEKAKFQTDANWKISFTPYDWSLNDIER